jgi:predicted nucleotidyltransferase
MPERYYYEKEIKALNKNRIKYLVIGGMAVNLYGIHRFTKDLDLMIDLSEKHWQKFLKAIGHLDYYTKVPENKWKNLTAIAFMNHRDEDKRIDVFLRNPMDFGRAYKNRKVFKIDNFRISCVSLKDLLKLKNQADRLRDWIDIGSIKRMQELKKNK